MPAFRLIGLDHQPFAALFDCTDAQLAAIGAERCVATAEFGFPCRVCLEDASVGDELLLLSFPHQPADSPYRASGPIFVRRGALPRTLGVGEIPPYVSRRLISVRGYDAAHRMLDAAVCEGSAVAAEIERQFADARIAYIHLHNAKRGCYSCRAERA